MASIKLGDWRMQREINQGVSEEELGLEENKLRKQIEEIGNNRPKPPQVLKGFSGSKLIGSGWEWAVYLQPEKKEVIKVPSGAFQEVNDPEYLKNTQIAYETCKRYLDDFIAESSFSRSVYEGKEVNMMKQQMIAGEELKFVNPRELSTVSRNYFASFAKKILKLADKTSWIPDMHLTKMKDGENWKLWNIIVEKEKPILFDFTSYYDVLRVYPEAMSRRLRRAKSEWKDFLNEMSFQ